MPLLVHHRAIQPLKMLTLAWGGVWFARGVGLIRGVSGGGLVCPGSFPETCPGGSTLSGDVRGSSGGTHPRTPPGHRAPPPDQAYLDLRGRGCRSTLLILSCRTRTAKKKNRQRIATPTSPRACYRTCTAETKQTMNCHTYLPQNLISQTRCINKIKRRIATPTSPTACCRKRTAETKTNEEFPNLPPREPAIANALQKQKQTKNCHTHLPESLLSQTHYRNKNKRRIATPTSPRACCRKRTAETKTNEELPHLPPREPAIANALQKQKQTKNCHTHLPESLLSQTHCRNKNK